MSAETPTTLRGPESCLEDAGWWLSVGAGLLLCYAFVRIPAVDLSASAGELPPLMQLLPLTRPVPLAERGLVLAHLVTTLLALSWPALFLGHPRRGTDPALAELAVLAPQTVAVRVTSALRGGLAVAMVLLLAGAPVLGLGLKTGMVEPEDVAMLVGVVLAQTTWMSILLSLMESAAATPGARLLTWGGMLGLSWIALVVGIPIPRGGFSWGLWQVLLNHTCLVVIATLLLVAGTSQTKVRKG